MKRPKLETFVNLALMVVAIAFAASLIAKYVEKHPTAGSPKPPIEIGTKIDVPGIEWGKRDPTLLLVLSTKCPFCTESMPFYKTLVQETAGRTRFIALFQQNEIEARQYLKENGVAIEDVRQLSPALLGVSGVPTLILTDTEGEVQDLWFGRVGLNVGALLLKRLKGEADNDGASLSPSELREILGRKEPIVLLNIDERSVYQLDHINGAINIPFDELESRMDDELKSSVRIIVYEQGPQKYAYAAFEILKNSGFKEVHVLRGGFQKWKASAPESAAKP